jgi:hypothetical protein
MANGCRPRINGQHAAGRMRSVAQRRAKVVFDRDQNAFGIENPAGLCLKQEFRVVGDRTAPVEAADLAEFDSSGGFLRGARLAKRGLDRYSIAQRKTLHRIICGGFSIVA